MSQAFYLDFAICKCAPLVLKLKNTVNIDSITEWCINTQSKIYLFPRCKQQTYQV